MGTRNTTRVYIGDKLYINQYGQWDGYPTGQGKTIMNFCASEYNLERLYDALTRDAIEGYRIKVPSTKLIDDDEVSKIVDLFDALPEEYRTSLKSRLLFSRDYGADVLYEVAFAQRYQILLRDNGYGLQEGNYVIRFDDDCIGDEGFKPKGVLEMEFHEHEKSFRLEDILGLSSDSITKMMKQWEDEIYKIENEE